MAWASPGDNRRFLAGELVEDVLPVEAPVGFLLSEAKAHEELRDVRREEIS